MDFLKKKVESYSELDRLLEVNSSATGFGSQDIAYHDQTAESTKTDYTENNLYYVTSDSGNESKAIIALQVQSHAKFLVSLVRSDEFVEGETSRTEMYLEGLHRDNVEVFEKSFEKAWLKLFSTSTEGFKTFINIASTIEYDWLGTKADSLVLSASSHKDPFVNEAAIRAMEAWEQPHHCEYMESIRRFDVEWLEEYRQNVAAFLRNLQ